MASHRSTATLTFNAVALHVVRGTEAVAREGCRVACAAGRHFRRVCAPTIEPRPVRVANKSERFLLLHRIEIESAVAQWIRRDVEGRSPGVVTEDVRTRVRHQQR